MFSGGDSPVQRSFVRFRCGTAFGAPPDAACEARERALLEEFTKDLKTPEQQAAFDEKLRRAFAQDVDGCYITHGVSPGGAYDQTAMQACMVKAVTDDKDRFGVAGGSKLNTRGYLTWSRQHSLLGVAGAGALDPAEKSA